MKPQLKSALLIIDMQRALFENARRHDAQGVVARITLLSRAVRRRSGIVIFIQHDGPPGDELAPGTPGWHILPAVERAPDDLLIRKTACDAFYRTTLQDELQKQAVRRLIITGCATDFCVDTTLRAAASRDFEVWVAADGHTTADRPHLDAASVIRHHNYLWEHLILPGRPVTVRPTPALIGGLEA